MTYKKIIFVKNIKVNQKILLIIFVLFSLVACKNGTEKKADDGKLYIVTTTAMVADAVINVVGENAEVVSLMGPGVDPHLYKATQGDLQKITDADMIFYNGLHLEGKMTEIFEKMAKSKPIYAIADGINKKRLLTVSEKGVKPATYDPHIWFNVDLWSETLAGIAAQVGKVDPDNADYYNQKAVHYKAVLAKLHSKAGFKLSTIPNAQRILITSHDAFGYFGKAYKFEVMGLQGMSTASEFGLQDVKQLVDYIVEKKIKAVFVESSVPRKPLEAVIEGCKDKGHDVKIGGSLFSDAMGAANSPEGKYIGMIEHNINTISNSLR